MVEPAIDTVAAASGTRLVSVTSPSTVPGAAARFALPADSCASTTVPDVARATSTQRHRRAGLESVIGHPDVRLERQYAATPREREAQSRHQAAGMEEHETLLRIRLSSP